LIYDLLRPKKAGSSISTIGPAGAGIPVLLMFDE